MPEHHPGEAYLQSVEDYAWECKSDIDNLRHILFERSWTRLEQYAAERTLQILIEACIGLAKHWARQYTGHTSSDAYTAFQRLVESNAIAELAPWRKVIGLRNVLVHDYLNVDQDIVRDIIEKQHYRMLVEFIHNAVEALKT